MNLCEGGGGELGGGRGGGGGVEMSGGESAKVGEGGGEGTGTGVEKSERAKSASGEIPFAEAKSVASTSSTRFNARRLRRESRPRASSASQLGSESSTLLRSFAPHPDLRNGV